MRKTLRYHFVSGKYMDVNFSLEKLAREIEILGKHLNDDCTGQGDTYGLNYRHVTHYEILED